MVTLNGALEKKTFQVMYQEDKLFISDGLTGGMEKTEMLLHGGLTEVQKHEQTQYMDMIIISSCVSLRDTNKVNLKH